MFKICLTAGNGTLLSFLMEGVHIFSKMIAKGVSILTKASDNQYDHRVKGQGQIYLKH